MYYSYTMASFSITASDEMSSEIILKYKWPELMLLHTGEKQLNLQKFLNNSKHIISKYISVKLIVKKIELLSTFSFYTVFNKKQISGNLIIFDRLRPPTYLSANITQPPFCDWSSKHDIYLIEALYISVYIYVALYISLYVCTIYI